MAGIVQMTARTLNALKGWPQPAAVDFNTQFDPTALALVNPVPPGACVCLNGSGKYILGVGNTQVMPLFTFHASDDPDVSDPQAGDPSTDFGVYVPISPTGQAMALVAIGAYELTSTFFDTSQPQNYTINTPLTSPQSGGNAGKLVPGVLHTNMIVGIVSRGIVDNGYGYQAVAFWPCPVFP